MWKIITLIIKQEMVNLWRYFPKKLAKKLWVFVSFIPSFTYPCG